MKRIFKHLICCSITPQINLVQYFAWNESHFLGKKTHWILYCNNNNNSIKSNNQNSPQQLFFSISKHEIEERERYLDIISFIIWGRFHLNEKFELMHVTSSKSLPCKDHSTPRFPSTGFWFDSTFQFFFLKLIFLLL